MIAIQLRTTACVVFATIVSICKGVKIPSIDYKLVDDLGLDSIDIADLLVKLEEELGITLPEDYNSNKKIYDDITVEQLTQLAEQCVLEQ